MQPKGLFHIDWNKRGLSLIVSPENSELEHLTVYALSLDKNEEESILFKNCEVAIFVIRGSAEFKVEDKVFNARAHDTLFLGPNVKATVIGKDPFLRAIVACAPSEIAKVTSFIPIDQVLKDSNLNRLVGEDNYVRQVITVIGDNIKAARLLAGYTWVKPGNWSSWPPHEHGDLMEEVYVFYELPPPGYGIQFVYENIDKASVYLVREDDVVVIPRGYHPNVVTPGFEMKYLWILSARRAFVDRKYGAWKVQPEFVK